MGDNGIHLITVVKRSLKFLILLLDDSLSGHEGYLLHHTHNKLLLIEGLGKEVAGSHLESLYKVLRRVKRCEEDNGDILELIVLLHDDCSIEAVDVGHHNVKKNKVGVLLASLLYTSITTVSSTNLEFLICQ